MIGGGASPQSRLSHTVRCPCDASPCTRGRMEAADSRRSYHCGARLALGALAATTTVATMTGSWLVVAGFLKTAG